MEASLDRTRFLRTCTLLAAGSLLTGQSPLTALAAAAPATPAPRYRAGEEGLILVSHNNGATWTVHANLGPHCVVENVRQEDGDTVAYVSYKGLVFKLKLSANGTCWVTA